jgi:3-hydroxyisobutyrate dehydrogenase
MRKTRVGFVGLGVMGKPMVANLDRAGYRVNLFDIDESAARAAAQGLDNGSVLGNPRAVALASDVVFTMLPSGEYVRSVVEGTDGLLEGFSEGDVLVDTSSSEPWITMDLARVLEGRNVQMVDAPVSGARIGAERAELVFMVGGDPAAVHRVTPILQTMGRQIFHLGPVGSGHRMKCLNNLITSTTLLATAEGMIIGKQFGLEPEVMVDVLNASTGMSWISQTHMKQRIINRAFDDPFRLALMVKDIGIAMELAREKGTSVPVSALVQQLWKAAENFSEENGSISNVVRWVEQLSKVEISPLQKSG